MLHPGAAAGVLAAAFAFAGAAWHVTRRH